MKLFTFVLMIVIGFRSYGVVPFEELKGLDQMVQDPKFSNVNGFLALETGTIERFRSFGLYELDAKYPLHKQFLHSAFLKKEGDDPHAFSKRFEYPTDAVSALFQWLFPSVDGASLVENLRNADPVGFLGQSLKSTPKYFASLLSTIQRYTLDPRTVKKFQQEIFEIIPRKYERKNKGGETTEVSIDPDINRFSKILYEALFMDGTFGKKQSKDGPFVYSHNPLYPKHIALHALLGYMWRVCDSKAQVIAVMREAGLLKTQTANEDARYTKADYESIKKLPNPTFEQLAFAGYAYEAYESLNPEMVSYSSADINVTEQDLAKYPYLLTHQPYPCCGETALRNLFNLVAFKGSGEFDGALLPCFDTPHMEKIKQFYRDFSNIALQKQSSASTGWSTIVSNLNGTEYPSGNPMDVLYDGYTNIKASLGMKNILNVMAKLTGDSVLNEMWREESLEKRHIAEKLTRLCEIFSRGQDFSMSWEIDGKTEEAPIHGGVKLTIARNDFSYDFMFTTSFSHFVITRSALLSNDWRKSKLNRVDNDLLKSFYDKDPPPFLNPLIMEQQDRVLEFWKQLNFPTTPLTLRFLYKKFGSVIEDNNAQRSIMKELDSFDRASPFIKNWVQALLIDKLGEKNPDWSNVFRYEFFKDIDFLKDLPYEARSLSVIVSLRLIEILKCSINYNHVVLQYEKDEALRIASSNGFIKSIPLLLAVGANVGAYDILGYTPLVRASMSGYEEIVRLLLDSGANPNGVNPEHPSALIKAVFKGYEKIVELLLNAGADIEAENKRGETALFCAGNKEIINMIEAERARRVVLDAAQFLKIQMDERSDAHMNLQDALNRRVCLHQAVASGNFEDVKTLVETGNHNVNARNYHGKTPLLLAAEHGYFEIFEYLMQKGADCGYVDQYGVDALSSADINENFDIVDYLIKEKKTSVSIFDPVWSSSLWRAFRGMDFDLARSLF